MSEPTETRHDAAHQQTSLDGCQAVQPDSPAETFTRAGILEQKVAQVQQAAERVRANIRQVIVGKEAEIDLLLVALLCEGHVLIEDVPDSAAKAGAAAGALCGVGGPLAGPVGGDST